MPAGVRELLGGLLFLPVRLEGAELIGEQVQGVSWTHARPAHQSHHLRQTKQQVRRGELGSFCFRVFMAGSPH